METRFIQITDSHLLLANPVKQINRFLAFILSYLLKVCQMSTLLSLA
jgi:hypothetical protein